MKDLVGGRLAPSDTSVGFLEAPKVLHSRPVVALRPLGDVVLDPFAGSGSVLVACERAHRRARLIELDPRYCDVIVDRYERLTGEEARLL